MKENWFNTLNECLNSENLIDAWPVHGRSIEYGETRQWRWDDGSKYGRFISIYRSNSTGHYERPVHYKI